MGRRNADRRRDHDRGQRKPGVRRGNNTIYAIGNFFDKLHPGLPNDPNNPGNPDNGTPYLFTATVDQSAAPGTFQPILKLGSGFNGGLAFLSPTELLAIRNDDAGTSSLYQINLVRFPDGQLIPGASTLARLFDLGHGFTGGLTIDVAHGGLYAIARDDAGASTLYRIGAGGALTAVNALGNTLFSGLAYDPLHQNFKAIGNDVDGLSSVYQITPGGSATLVLPLGQGFSGGLTFVPRGLGGGGFVDAYFAIQGSGDGSVILFDVTPLVGEVVASGSVEVQFTDGFNVLGGPHSYAAADHLPVSVHIKDHGGSFITAESSATVVDRPPVMVSSATITDGIFPGISTGMLTLASFTVPGGLETGPGEYSAAIDWGDGNSDAGTLAISGNIITVSGHHTYGFTAGGILHPTVTLTDDTGGSATANDTIFVAPDVSGKVSHLGTAPILNPATGLYYADLTVTNVSTAGITGPLYVMLQGLPAGVTPTSFTHTDTRGDPWIKFDRSVWRRVPACPTSRLSSPTPLAFRSTTRSRFTTACRRTRHWRSSRM